MGSRYFFHAMSLALNTRPHAKPQTSVCGSAVIQEKPGTCGNAQASGSRTTRKLEQSFNREISFAGVIGKRQDTSFRRQLAYLLGNGGE
jgi:hypothetical protein